MALKRSNMRDKVRTIRVTWEDETLDVGIRPGRFTAELMDRITQATRVAERAETEGDDAAAEQATATVAQATAEVIAWWDVLDDDGARLPVTAEVLNTLPLSFVRHVVQQVGESARPPASKG